MSNKARTMMCSTFSAKSRKTELNNIEEIVNKTLNRKLNEEFYKRVIELENEIQLSQNPSLKLIEELMTLYEKALEFFTETHCRQKVQYFKNKLTKLIIGYNKTKKKLANKKNQSRWTRLMNAHQKNKNKFMLFLTVETSRKEVGNILDDREKRIRNGYNEIIKELEEQNKRFEERKKGKKKKNQKGNDEDEKEEKEEKKIYTSISNKLRFRNEKLDASLTDFMKKLHYIYVHSKIFETPIEALNEILEQIFLHKINKYYYYQDQIKNFELMQKDAEKEGEKQDEGIEFLIKDLQNERKSYYLSLEALIDKIRNNIKEKCSDTSSNDDRTIKNYLNELMNNISNIFI